MDRGDRDDLSPNAGLKPAPILAAGTHVAPHLHRQGYAAVVLSGAYEEGGDLARWRVGPGDVLVHPPFCTHFNRVRRSAVVLNLPLPSSAQISGFAGTVADPDTIVRMAERSGRAAAEALREQWRLGLPSVEEEVDDLAARLAGAGPMNLDHWAREHGLSRVTAFRRFRAAFGMSPQDFRRSARAGRALRNVLVTDTPLAWIAGAIGYADQSHMTRHTRQVAGVTPAALRASG